MTCEGKRPLSDLSQFFDESLSKSHLEHALNIETFGLQKHWQALRARHVQSTYCRVHTEAGMQPDDHIGRTRVATIH